MNIARNEAIERNLGCFFYYKKSRKEGASMNRLTDGEKEVLYIYGSPSLRDTHKRLGRACMLMVDPITKANACSLRNKLAEMTCQYSYYCMYASVREELGDLVYKGNVA